MSELLNDLPSRIVQKLLAELSLGTLPSSNGNWPVHCNKEPSSPDNAITLYDQEGVTQGRLQVTGQVVSFPGIQFRIRGEDQNTAQAKAISLRNALDTLVPRTVTVEGSRYLVNAVHRTGNLISLGRENPTTTNRYLFTLNSTVTIEMVT